MKNISVSIITGLCLAILVISCRKTNEDTRDEAEREPNGAILYTMILLVGVEEDFYSTVSEPVVDSDQQLDEDYQEMQKLTFGEIVKIAFSGEDVEIPWDKASISQEVWRRMLAIHFFMTHDGKLIRAVFIEQILGDNSTNKAIAVTISSLKTEKDLTGRLSRIVSILGDSPIVRERFASFNSLSVLKLEVIGRKNFPQIKDMSAKEIQQRGWAN